MQDIRVKVIKYSHYLAATNCCKIVVVVVKEYRKKRYKTPHVENAMRIIPKGEKRGNSVQGK